MIRLSDAAVLAYTKLRTHRVRTGLTVGVAGILFGLLFGGVFIAQGIFDSVDKFNKEGLADRSIVNVSKYDNTQFNAYEHIDDEEFIAEVKKAHADRVALKTAAAKKYGITYDPKTEDPLPIEKDKDSGKERIGDMALGNEVVVSVADRRSQEQYVPLDIKAFLAPYRTAKVLEGNTFVQPAEGSILPMEGGKEKVIEDGREQFRSQMGGYQDTPIIQVMNGSVVAPFVMNADAELQEGELPGVVSFSYAEKLLGLEKLSSGSTNEQKMARLQEVRRRINDISASFCYRNQASQGLLSQATAQQKEISSNKDNKDYVMPSVIYALPVADSCGAVTITKDTRSAAEKRAATNLEAYQKEIGTYPGEPEQHKVQLRAIGLSGDAPGIGTAGGATDLVAGLLGSWLGHGATWTIPADMLAEAPEALRPEAIFTSRPLSNELFGSESYMVEFGDKEEARTLLNQIDFSSNVMVMPFGSATLTVDQFKQWFSVALLWALMIVGGVALIILASLIGRMVSDGRRESAVFRAIGAKRIDIGSIYGMYALLLSLRVALFTLVVGLAIALGMQLWLSADATLAARLSYAAIDTNKSFNFIGIGSWYIPAMLGVIIATGLLASIIPIFLGSRRNPIKDMRDDT